MFLVFVRNVSRARRERNNSGRESILDSQNSGSVESLFAEIALNTSGDNGNAIGASFVDGAAAASSNGHTSNGAGHASNKTK